VKEQSTARSRAAVGVAAGLVVIGGALGARAPSPLLSILVVILIALMVPASLLARRLGSAWPVAAVASAFFAAMAGKQWAEQWRAYRIPWFALFLFLSAAAALAGAREGLHELRKQRRESGPKRTA
jgi:hypothetical protein